VAVDGTGALNGLTVNAGGSASVFRLTPAAGGKQWTFATLSSFITEGGGSPPNDSLAFDDTGAIYGTVPNGAVFGLGAVFKMIPPAQSGGAWSNTLLYSFSGGADGDGPSSGVVLGKDGALYGTTRGGGSSQSNCSSGICGTLFRLTPPANPGGAWTETILHRFDGKTHDEDIEPSGSLVIDDHGALYGIDGAGVFQVMPPAVPGGDWGEKVIYHRSEDNVGGGIHLAIRKGTLYLTFWNSLADYAGSVFTLKPPATGDGPWVKRVLYNFKGHPTDGQRPYTGADGMAVDSDRTIYGVTYNGGPSHNCKRAGCGVVYRLTPPSASGGKWAETILYSFTGGADGAYPAGLALRGKTLYGIAEGADRRGLVFRLSPPAAPGGAWIYAIVRTFQRKDGRYLQSIKYHKGALYGTAISAGTLSWGTVFQLEF
jgi:hypothetical protein